MGRAFPVDTITELKSRIETCKEYQEQILKYIHDLKAKVLKREITYSDYEELLEREIKGKTAGEWLEFYDSLVKKYEQEIKKQNRKNLRKKIFVIFYAVFVLALLIWIASFLRPTFVGHVIKETPQEFSQTINLEFNESTEYIWELEHPSLLNSVKLSGAIEGERIQTDRIDEQKEGEVKIYLDNLLILDSNNIEKQEKEVITTSKRAGITGMAIGELGTEQTNEIKSQNESYSEENQTQGALQQESPSQEEPPVTSEIENTTESIENITPEAPTEKREQTTIKEFTNICEETCNIKDLNLNKTSYTLRIEIINAKLFLEKINYEIITREISELPEITENITLETKQKIAEIGKPVNWKAKIKAKNLDEARKSLPKIASLISEQQVGEIFEINYETPAPIKLEEITAKGKKITITGPDEIHYENIVAYTTLEKEVPENKIRLYHITTEGKEQIDFLASDNNNNGLIDKIEWLVPSLSEQIYELIIEISKAEHLDENKQFISDIYEQVKALDDIWSPTINNNEYVRVTFKQKLDNTRDITIYPRVIQGNPKIEVYEYEKNEVIAEFTNLNSNQYNKVYLTNLQTSQDVFDLRVIGGSVEIEHIIDPTQEWFADCVDLSAWTLNPASGWASTGGSCTSTNSEDDNMTRQTDLTGRDTANINFWWENSKLDLGEYFNVYAGTSSASLTKIFSNQGNAGTQSGTENIDITSYISATTTIRFECLGSDGGEACNIDNINLTTTSPLDVTPPTFTNVVSNKSIIYKTTLVPVDFNATDASGISSYQINWTEKFNISSNDGVLSNTSSLGAGKYQINVSVNDTLNNFGFLIYTIEVNQSSSNVTIYIDGLSQNKSIYNGTKVWLNATLIRGAGNVYLYKNQTLINNASTSPATNYTNFTNLGDYNITGYYFGNENYSENWSYSFYVNATQYFDTTPPTFTNVVSNKSVIYKNTLVPVDFNATDTESSISSYQINWTEKFNISSDDGVFSNTSTLGAGIYQINVSANDTSGNFGFLIYTVEVNQSGATNITLYLDGLTANKTITNGTKVWLNATLITGGKGYLDLYNNGTLINNISTSPAVNLTNFTDSGTSFNITARFEGNENYTANWSNYNLFVDVNDPPDITPPTFTNIISNKSIIYKNTLVPVDFNASDGKGISSYQINWTEKFNISSDDGVFSNTSTLGAGIYQINVSANDTSGNFGFLIYTVEVNQSGNTNITIYINGTTANATITSNSTIWLNATLITGGKGYLDLYKNGTVINNYSGTPAVNLTNFTDAGTSFNITALFEGNENYTSNWSTYNLFVDVNAQITNQAPQIIYVQNETLGSGVTPIGDNFVIVQLNVTVYDPDEATDINDNSINMNFTKPNEAARVNTSCTQVIDFNTYYANYSCLVNMWYFDRQGDWNITVYAEDLSLVSAANQSTSFTYKQLQSIKINEKLLTLTANIGQQNQTFGPSTINNTGNYNSSEKIAANAINLYGDIRQNEFIDAANFTIDIDTGGTPPAECDGIQQANNTDKTITGVVLERGNLSLGGGVAQEKIYYCINNLPIPSSISSQSYSTTLTQSWTIKILVAALIITGKRKKKKKLRVVEDDKLIQTLNLIIDELKEKHALDKKEIIDLVFKELKKKYKTSRREIVEIIEKEQKTIPVTIFSKELGGLESLTKYLKEDLNLTYKEISEILKRDERTIWTTYQKACKKQLQAIKPEETEIYLPLTIFNKELTILESSIIYLKSKGLKYNEIAKLIDRNQRNIYTIYSRAVKKLKRKI